MGRIVSLALETKSEKTTLEIVINHLVKFVSAIALARDIYFLRGGIRHLTHCFRYR